MTKATQTTGIVVRTFADKGFVFVETPEGDIFVHFSKAGDMSELLVERATVELSFVTEFNENARSDRDQFRRTATQIFSVEAPAELEEVEVLTVVLFFDKKKGFGRVACGDSFSMDTAYLSAAVCEVAEVTPGKGMAVRAVVVEGHKGPDVISFEWKDPQIAKDFARINAPEPEVGKLKFFNYKKNFGFIVDENGNDVHFHLDGVAEDMRKRMRQGKFPKGTTFSFVESKFAGKMTAKIVSLIALPENPAVKTEVVVADEGITPEPVAATEVEAVLESEEVAKKAAPKKPATKKATEAPKGKIATVAVSTEGMNGSGGNAMAQTMQEAGVSTVQ